MSQTYAPGARVVVRDEEWIVRSVRQTDTGGLAVHVTGLSELVRNKNAIFLDELDRLEELTPETTRLVHDPSPRYRRSRLYLESLLRRTPPTDARLYVGHRAAMEPTNYQLVPAAQALAQPSPRILIADAVGLGKTLEAGILLSELIRRGRGQRILVVALKSILTQFQEEMWARFTIPLVRLDSVGIRRVQARIPSNMNPFYYFDRVIISIDTLKKDEKYRRYLEACHWDVIVVDECQHVAVRSRGSAGGKSQRARLAGLLARTCDALILTSATPHDGRPESFASLMNLLDPTAVADESDYTREEIQGLFVRRFKKDVAAEVSQSFAERQVRSHHVNAGGAENAVFAKLAGLVFQTIDQSRRSGGILFRTTLLKAFLSSPAACLQTIEARLKKLEKLTGPAAEHDRRELEALAALVRAVTPPTFSKLDRLFSVLDEFSQERVVIFSERIETLRFLQQQIRKRYSLSAEQVGVFYGTLDDQKQQAMVKDFGTANGKVRILLGSDAASEGINLHYFCHRLVHFDIPWSLITLEQRNGRIDRFGQQQTPDIRYLLTVPGVEETRGDLRVLDRLVEKENAAHKNLGDVAWLMNLHEAEAEEQRVGRGIEEHEAPEDIVPDEPQEEVDFLALLMAEDEQEEVETVQPFSLYKDDLHYAREAFEELTDLTPPEWHDHLDGFTLRAPADLQVRYQYLPPELARPHWEVKLTTDRERVQKALAASRQDEASWPEWELFWDQHPLAEWLNDRVLSLFIRHEAPVLRLPDFQGPVFLFQGVLSNLRSQPVFVDWFGVRLPQEVVPLEELRPRLGETLTNPGHDFDEGALRNELGPALEVARAHLKSRREERGRRLGALLRPEERRVSRWRDRRLAAIDAAVAHKGRALRKDEERRYAHEREEVEKRVAARRRWVDEGLRTSEKPYLRLAAVLVDANILHGI